MPLEGTAAIGSRCPLGRAVLVLRLEPDRVIDAGRTRALNGQPRDLGGYARERFAPSAALGVLLGLILVVDR